MSTELSCTKIAEAKIQEGIAHCQKKLELRRMLSVRLDKYMHALATVLSSIVSSVDSDEFTYQNGNDHQLELKLANRRLLFVPAEGVALDSRLRHPKGLYCKQIYALLIAAPNEEAKLYASFRIYPDGTASDGEACWKLEENWDQFSEYVTSIVVDGLLLEDDYWAGEEEFQNIKTALLDVRPAPVEGIKEQACIGYECAIHGKKITNVAKHAD